MKLPSARGFTLIEMMIAMVVVAILMALLLPFIQRARESARRTQCLSNMKELGNALFQYVSDQGVFPPSLTPHASPNWLDQLSINVRLLPEIAGQETYNAFNFSAGFPTWANRTVSGVVINGLLCPSDPNKKFGNFSGTNYGWCMGDWSVWSGLNGSGPNRSAFGPNQSIRWADFTGFRGNTIILAEVKTGQPYLTDCGGLSKLNEASVDAYRVPLISINTSEYTNGKCILRTDGHTRWFDGSVHQTGFTTAWPPNFVTNNANGIDVDLVDKREILGGPTFAAITSRSYHDGGANVLYADGSVRKVTSKIYLPTWRVIGTPAWDEVGGDSY